MKQATTVSLALERYGQKRGITYGVHSQLAKELGVCRQTVWGWCKRNSVTPKYLEQFAQLTGVKASELNKLTRRVCED